MPVLCSDGMCEEGMGLSEPNDPPGSTTADDDRYEEQCTVHAVVFAVLSCMLLICFLRASALHDQCAEHLWYYTTSIVRMALSKCIV